MTEPDAAPHFELGLSLAGGVSCGAWTAGVLDFIVEALDAWQAGLERGDPDAPDHQVRLCAVGGASSGALSAAILTTVLAHRLPAVRSHTPLPEAALNPLYDSWVNMTGLHDLLGSGDARAGRPRSLFDPTPVERAARKAVGHGLPVRERPRRWLSDPLHLLMSVADLQGLRYPGAADGRPAPVVTDHAAMLRFAVFGAGAGESASLRSDESPVNLRPEAADPAGRWSAWGQELSAVALASSAVPLALPPRRLSRPWSHFVPRPEPPPACCDAPHGALPMEPIRTQLATDLRTFDGADGGLVDNTALGALWAHLNGTDGQRPQGDGAVWHAVVMVDPLLGGSRPPPEPARRPDGLLAQLRALGGLLLDEALVGRSDLALALEDTVYSRFLISPGREMVNQGGAADLAGAALGGLGGYLSSDFRRHDYLLGRRNAQQALAFHLTLPSSHSLFKRWTYAQRERLAVGPHGELPVVPLVGRLHPVSGEGEPAVDWPLLAVDPSHFNRDIEGRLQTLFNAFLSPIWRLLLYLPWHWGLRPFLRRLAVRALGAGLRQHRLQ